MIKRFNAINNFCSYKGFSMNVGDDFKKYNIIYGDSGTGKTSLSTIFQSLEHMDNSYLSKNRTCDVDGDPVVEICFNDNELITSSCSGWELKNTHVKVFNQIYIEENVADQINIDTDSKTSNSDKIIKNLISKSRIDLDKVNIEYTSYKKQRDREAEKINDKIKEHIKSLKRTFPRRKKYLKQITLEKLVKCNHSNDHTIEELSKELTAYKERYNVLINKELKNFDFTKISITMDDYIWDSDKISSILTFDEEYLLNEIAEEVFSKRDFIEMGLGLLKENKSDCPFCSQSLLSVEVSKKIENYKKILNSKRTTYINLINETIEQLEKKKRMIVDDKKVIMDLTQHYGELIDGEIKNEHIKRGIEDCINSIIEILYLKRENVVNKTPGLYTKYNEVKKQLTTLFLKLKNINDTIDNIQNKLEQSEKEINKLLNGVATTVQKVLTIEMSKSLTLYKKAVAHLDALDIKKVELDHKYKELTLKSKLIINTFNKVLPACGLYKFKLNNAFELENEERGNSSAQEQLSHAEKTILAFSYFMAELRATLDYKKLRDTIVFIDDPMSGLDEKHLIRIINIIKEIDTIAFEEPSDHNKIKQLFVTTDNFKFYSMLKDRYKNPKNINGYFVKKVNNESKIMLDDSIAVNEYVVKMNKIFDVSENGIVESDVLILGKFIVDCLKVFNKYKRINCVSLYELKELLPSCFSREDNLYRENHVVLDDLSKVETLTELVRHYGESSLDEITKIKPKNLLKTARMFINYIVIVDRLHLSNIVGVTI